MRNGAKGQGHMLRLRNEAKSKQESTLFLKPAPDRKWPQTLYDVLYCFIWSNIDEPPAESFVRISYSTMSASTFRGRVSAMYPSSDEERLCVCNTITTTYLLLRILLLYMDKKEHDNC